MADLVDIFEYAPPELVGTVEQQRLFYERWIAAITGGTDSVKPFDGELAEAKRHPNGWIYRVAGTFGVNEKIPPEAIVGAWKVDAQGKIGGEFIRNPKYDPKRWPAGKDTP